MGFTTLLHFFIMYDFFCLFARRTGRKRHGKYGTWKQFIRGDSHSFYTRARGFTFFVHNMATVHFLSYFIPSKTLLYCLLLRQMNLLF
jgi:hypothetical protein